MSLAVTLILAIITFFAGITLFTFGFGFWMALFVISVGVISWLVEIVRETGRS